MKERNKIYSNTQEYRERSKERALIMYKERPEIKEKIRKTVTENYRKNPELLKKLANYNRKDIKSVICVETGFHIFLY